jgi:hypothetical protein
LLVGAHVVIVHDHQPGDPHDPPGRADADVERVVDVLAELAGVAGGGLEDGIRC